jgi:CRISPR-associated endonuclease/helicase Cas3
VVAEVVSECVSCVDDARLAARRLLAKSGRVDGPHTLFAHSLDVGLVAGALLERNPVVVECLAEDLGLSVEVVGGWVAGVVGLHDLGKASGWFQCLLRGNPSNFGVRARHGALSVLFLSGELRDRGWGEEVAFGVAHAVGSHHGVRFSRSAVASSLGTEDAEWGRWRSALVRDVFSVFGVPEAPRMVGGLPLRSWVLLAGLASVADWVGSRLPHVGDVIVDAAEYVRGRKGAVAEVLSDVGFPLGECWWREDAVGSFGVGAALVPRPVQVVVRDALVGDVSKPGLLVVEAPTGEGKSEAAFGCLLHADARQGAYFALPTQASSDAMFERLRAFTETVKAREVALTLAHSGVRRFVGGAGAVGDDGWVSGASWFSGARRELLSEFGVGTVDQVLLGVLPKKHFFVRLFALAGRTLVVDEVHAYDAFSGGLLERLLVWAGALRVRVVLLSATLPTGARERLVNAYVRGLGDAGGGAGVLLDAGVAYPRLTTVSRDGVVVEGSFEGVRGRSVRLKAAPFAVGDLAVAVRDAALGGGAVGVVVNSVTRAQDVTRELRKLGVNGWLLHSRFSAAARRSKERELLRRLGAGGAGGRDGVFVGTQVLEQSLDVDFDVLFSDLAPVDLLLQRMGRLHRHARCREAHAEPVFHVSGLGEMGERPDPKVFGGVYDRSVMWRSWAVLQTRHGGLIVEPVDADVLTQLVYGPESLPALKGVTEYETAVVTAGGWENHKAALAEKSSVGGPLDAASSMWGTDLVDLVGTRLGADSVEVIPVQVDGGGCWVLFPSGERFDPCFGLPSGEWIHAALEGAVRVSGSLASGLSKVKISAPNSGFWEECGELQLAVPLLVDAFGNAVDVDGVRYCADLGLVQGLSRFA